MHGLEISHLTVAAIFVVAKGAPLVRVLHLIDVSATPQSLEQK